jgi:uncharacterized protein YndB with AHSA1/START domain
MDESTTDFKPPVSDESVRAKTGKGWDDWFKILDAAGAAKLAHAEIVAILAKKHSKDVGAWWQQMLTVGYERARGLRQTHETTTGFVAGVSKTIGVDVQELYDAWADARRRSQWLKGEKATVKSSSHAKSMRLLWPDGSVVEVNFSAKGRGKSVVAVQHTKLPDAKAVERVKAAWKGHLDALKVMLE